MRRLVAPLLSLLILCLIVAVPLLAQEGGAGATAEAGGICVMYGAVLAVAVSILKRLPFGIGKWIARNPKTCAAFLSAVAALAPLLKHSGMTISQLAVCVSAYFAGSVATYESLLKPVGRAMALSDPY